MTIQYRYSTVIAKSVSLFVCMYSSVYSFFNKRLNKLFKSHDMPDTVLVNQRSQYNVIKCMF